MQWINCQRDNVQEDMLKKPIGNKAKQDIFGRAVKGGGWVLTTRIVQQLMASCRWLILARFLFPKDFGLLGIALLSLSIVRVFTETGFNEALVQRKEVTKEHLNTAWTIGIIRVLVLYLFIFFLAPFVTIFFDGKPELIERDISKPIVLIQRLKNSSDPLSRYISENLRPETKVLLSTFDSSEQATTVLKLQLVDDLNQIIRTRSIYDPGMFKNIKISPYVRKLIYNSDKPEYFTKLNRYLIQESFPEEIKPAIIDHHAVVQIIRVIGLMLLLGGFSNIGTVYFRKELQFQKIFIVQFFSTFFSASISISLAILYRSVWALVFGQMASSIVKFILGYILHPYRPKLSLDLPKAKELWQYGQHVFVTKIVKFLILEGDDILVAKMLGVATLGLYQFAYKLANMAATQISDVISKVTFPAYSKLQDNRVKLVAGYEKSLRVITLLCYPVTFGLMILAYDFTKIVLGEHWLAMVPAMRILCLVGLARCNQGGNIFQGLGRPDIVKRISIVRLTLIAITIYPLTLFWGIEGTAVCIVGSTFCIIPMLLYNVKKIIGHTFTDYAKLISLPLFSSAVMCFVMFLSRGLLADINLIELVGLVCAGGATYCVSVLLLSRFYKGYNVITLLREIKKGMF